MIFRVISAVIGLSILVGTVRLAQNLLGREFDVSVLLAGYMGIGGIMLGAYFLLYALTGERQPNLNNRNKTR